MTCSSYPTNKRTANQSQSNLILIYYFIIESGGIVGNVNIFSGLLSLDKMKAITNGTDCGMKGDYLAWDSSQWEFDNSRVRYFQIESEELCFNYGDKKFTKISRRSQPDALHTCSKLNNGLIPRVETDEDLGKFYEFARMEYLTLETMKNSSSINFDNSLTPYIYQGGESNNTYYNLYLDEVFQTPTPRILSWQYSGVGQIVQLLREDRFGPGIHWYLRDPDGYKEETTCISHGRLLFLIKGVCKSSFLWKFTTQPFHLVNKNPWGKRNTYSNHKHSDIVYFINEFNAKITMHFSFSLSAWELRQKSDDGSSKVLASVKSTLASMALGTNIWTIYRDTRECNMNEGEEYSSPISLSVCSESEFTCNDGNCVLMDHRCNSYSLSFLV